MKIAVYTICKNEADFVERWVNSCLDADYILVVDTGSGIKTLTELDKQQSLHPDKFHYQDITVFPWRFDLARNYSLMSIPSDVDVCICLDMDEVLVEGWRKIIEDHWELNSTDRLRYKYVWSWKEDGSEGVTYHGDKIHARHGFRWKHPVHEVLVKDNRLNPEIQKFIEHKLIEHHPDNTKSRSQYLPLLKLSVQEDPLDDRNAHYYARELMFNEEYELAIIEFKRHLALDTAKWKSERAASYRYMGDCHWALGNIGQAINCFDNAAIESPYEREPYVALAQAFRYLESWSMVVHYCTKALDIVDKPTSYINSESAWSDWPETMLKEAQEKLLQKGCNIA